MSCKQHFSPLLLFSYVVQYLPGKTQLNTTGPLGRTVERHTALLTALLSINTNSNGGPLITAQEFHSEMSSSPFPLSPSLPIFTHCFSSLQSRLRTWPHTCLRKQKLPHFPPSMPPCVSLPSVLPSLSLLLARPTCRHPSFLSPPTPAPHPCMLSPTSAPLRIMQRRVTWAQNPEVFLVFLLPSLCI